MLNDHLAGSRPWWDAEEEKSCLLEIHDVEDYLLFVWKCHWVSLTLFLPEWWRSLLYHHVHFLPLSLLSGGCFSLFILESHIVITMNLHRKPCRDFPNLSLHFRILTQLTKAETFYRLYATVALWHPTILVSLLRRLAYLLHLFLKTFGFLISLFCTRVTLSKYILCLICQRGMGPFHL